MQRMTRTGLAAEERYLLCPDEGSRRGECMAEGVAAFDIVHSERLR